MPDRETHHELALHGNGGVCVEVRVPRETDPHEAARLLHAIADKVALDGLPWPEPDERLWGRGDGLWRDRLVPAPAKPTTQDRKEGMPG